MPRPVTIPLYAALALSLFVFAACTDSNDDPSSDTSDSPPSPTTTTDRTGTPAAADRTGTPGAAGQTATPTAPAGSAQPGAGGEGPWDASVLELRDGTWPVGDAGEVEFTADGGQLTLVEVRPADGWTETDRDIESDEIEIDFQRGNVEWRIEVELKDGVLEIEIDQDIDGADPGVYTVGLAGTVEFAMANGGLNLVETTANDGWTYTVEEQESDDIEVDFRMGNVTWDLNVDLDDGEIDVEVDFEIEGSYP